MTRKHMLVVMVVVSCAAVSFAVEAKAADGGKRRPRNGRPVRVVSPAPEPTVDKSEGVLTRSIPLSSVLQAEGIETEADVSRLLTSLFPPSFKLLTGGGIVVNDFALVDQFTIPSTRPGFSHPIPVPEATVEDGPPVEVLEFTGWAGDYSLAGSLFVAGDELVVDLEWTDPDGTIVLAESMARTIEVSAPSDGTASAVGNRVVGIHQKVWRCKCTHILGNCKPTSCDRGKRCHDSSNWCTWVYGDDPT